jgi:hypothetical protein
MSADNRSTHTDALASLGTIINEGEKRDAIHLAVEPVIAGQRLAPGMHVGLKDGRAFGEGVKGVGIVDPFLTTPVRKGERFWLVVYPRQITSLRHVWEHPDFPASGETGDISVSQPSKEASEKWLRDFIATADCPDYETVIAAAVNNDDSDYLYFSGMDAHGPIPPEFWTHVEVVTGRTIYAAQRAEYFSCAC